MQTYEALIFDCDGVLVNSEELVQAVELTLLAELGLEYDHEEFSRRFLGTSDVHFFEALSADFLAQLGKPLPTAFPDMLKTRARESFDRHLAAIDGVHDVIASWKQKLAVASSSSVMGLKYKLHLTSLASHFGEHVYSAEHVGIGKPDPAVFLHSAERLAVHPAACIVIEDSVNGVLAGKAAGMHTIGFTGGGHCLPGHGDELLDAGADLVLDSMQAIRESLAAY